MERLINKDRRTFARFASKVPLKYKNLETGLDTEAFMQDIGAGGLKFITTERLINLNDALEVSIKTPNSSNSVELKGKVIWLREVSSEVWDVGISFNRAKLVEVSKVCRSLNLTT